MSVLPLSNSTGLVGTILRGRGDLIDLQRQLATGKAAETYGGLAANSRLTVLSLRAETSAITGYRGVIENIDIRLRLAQQTLGRFKDIADQARSDALTSPFDLIDGQRTQSQKSAALMLSEMVGLLNQEINGRHLFSGRDVATAPVADAELILHGDGARAGLVQLIDERRQADVGASGLGRLVLSAPGATGARLAEEADGLPFGFKLVGATTTAAGVSVSGPAGSPPALDIDFSGGQPAAGDTVRLTLSLPDGSTGTLELTATTATPAQPGRFLIGADTTETAANFRTGLQDEIGRLADTELTAASAVRASEAFFAGSRGSPPLRVDGPPFDTATGQVAGTADNTVIWYLGDDSASPARQSALAQIDSAQTVAYGMRADEEAIRNTVSRLGLLAAMTFDEADPNAGARYQALNSRVGRDLDTVPGRQSMADMMAEIAGVQRAMQAADERHAVARAMMEAIVVERESISAEEVSMKILALQTRLQASMETTAILARLSLVAFI